MPAPVSRVLDSREKTLGRLITGSSKAYYIGFDPVKQNFILNDRLKSSIQNILAKIQRRN